MNNIKNPKIRHKGSFSTLTYYVTIIISFTYLLWWFNINNIGDPILYGLLLIGEIYHVWQAVGYVVTTYNQQTPKVPKLLNTPLVDVYITVCGEPVEIVEKTVIAAKQMNYPNFKIFILNDGFVADKPNWKEINILAKKHKVESITRTTPGGAKAGNINNALTLTKGRYFAIFDADHMPHSDFLQKTVPFMQDSDMALVQTPQYYKNNKHNYLTEGSWEQQELFFGPIMRGKSNLNSAFWCGTNALLRRTSIEQIGYLPTDNIAEDFLVSLMLHKSGWNSIYYPKVLAQGLAPHNLKEYVKQQYRWARGSLEIIFKHNPAFYSSMSLMQRFQYLYSASFYLNGFIVLINALVPIFVLFTGISPLSTNTASFVIVFFPFIASTVYVLNKSTGGKMTFRSLQMSMSLFYVFIKAAVSVITGKKDTFEVTAKEEVKGNFIYLALPHLIYLGLGLAAISFSYYFYGITPHLINNASWVIFNSILFSSFIYASYPWVAQAKAVSRYLVRLITLKKVDIFAPKEVYIKVNSKENVK